MTLTWTPTAADFAAHLAQRPGTAMLARLASRADADAGLARMARPPAGGDPEVLLVREPGGRWLVRVDREQHTVALNISVLDLEATDQAELRGLILEVGVCVLLQLRAYPDAFDEALPGVVIMASGRPVKP